MSFHRGAIGNARIASDGKTILYSAAWEGKPAQIYSTRVDSSESTALPLPSADLLSISATGKLAILVLHGSDPAAIAEVALAGGAPRELVAADPPEALQFSGQIADYAPGEDRLAIVRNGQLEFPVGKVLVPVRRTTGRSSRSGSCRTASRSPTPSRRDVDDQALGIVDLAGGKKILTSGWEIISSIAWNPVSKEIWFSGRKKTNHIGVVELHAISLSGKERLVAQNPQLIIVQDIAPDGRVLARSDDWPETMVCLAPGAAREQDLTWLDFSESVALSDDGSDLLFVEGGAGAGATGGTYMRKTDGSNAAVRLTDGWIRRQALSPDRKLVAQVVDGAINLVPVGAGESRTIRDKDVQYIRADVVSRREAAASDGRESRPLEADVGAGPRGRAAAADHARRRRGGEDVSRRKARRGGEHEDATSGPSIPPTRQEIPGPFPARGRGEEVIGFDEKGQSLNVYSGDLKLRIERLDLATGKRTFVREVTPADPTGVARISTLQLTPDGRAYCYSFMRSLSRLYMVDGLR